jgi:hypothetical protein
MILLMWKKIKQTFDYIKCLATPNVSPGVIYKVIDINPDTLNVVIRCINTTTNVKDKIPYIIKDKDILSGLEPVEACWLGYYYGRAIQKKSADVVKKSTDDVSFLLRNTRGKYRIHSLNRGGMISFIDTSTNVISEKLVIRIAKDEAMVNQFDPSQACYIGILAGLQEERTVGTSNPTKPILTLVK